MDVYIMMHVLYSRCKLYNIVLFLWLNQQNGIQVFIITLKLDATYVPNQAKINLYAHLSKNTKAEPGQVVCLIKSSARLFYFSHFPFFQPPGPHLAEFATYLSNP